MNIYLYEHPIDVDLGDFGKKELRTNLHLDAEVLDQFVEEYSLAQVACYLDIPIMQEDAAIEYIRDNYCQELMQTFIDGSCVEGISEFIQYVASSKPEALTMALRKVLENNDEVKEYCKERLDDLDTLQRVENSKPKYLPVGAKAVFTKDSSLSKVGDIAEVIRVQETDFVCPYYVRLITGENKGNIIWVSAGSVKEIELGTKYYLMVDKNSSPALMDFEVGELYKENDDGSITDADGCNIVIEYGVERGFFKPVFLNSQSELIENSNQKEYSGLSLAAVPMDKRHGLKVKCLVDDYPFDEGDVVEVIIDDSFKGVQKTRAMMPNSKNSIILYLPSWKVI